MVRRRRTLKAQWIVSLAAILVVIATACTNVPPVPTSTPIPPTPTPIPPTPTPAFEISDVQLSKEFYGAGKETANAKYNNKIIVVSGIIDQITKKSGLIDVKLLGHHSRVVCKFYPAEYNSIADFVKGQLVHLRGTVIGVPGWQDVVIERCSVQKSDEAQTTAPTTPVPTFTPTSIPPPVPTPTPVPTFTPTSIPPPVPTPTPAFEVSGVQLSKEFSRDEAAADAKYKNKTIILYGIVDRIEKRHNLTDVKLDGYTNNVVCKFYPTEYHSIVDFVKGQRVHLLGQVIGVPGWSDVVLDRCSVPDSEKPSPTPEPLPTPESFIKSTVLVRTFERNESTGMALYGGKNILISGLVTSISKSGFTTEVKLEGKPLSVTAAKAVCKFNHSESHLAASLNKGDFAVLQGVVEGVPGLWDVVLEQCTVPNRNSLSADQRQQIEEQETLSQILDLHHIPINTVVSLGTLGMQQSDEVWKNKPTAGVTVESTVQMEGLTQAKYTHWILTPHDSSQGNQSWPVYARTSPFPQCMYFGQPGSCPSGTAVGYDAAVGLSLVRLTTDLYSGWVSVDPPTSYSIKDGEEVIAVGYRYWYDQGNNPWREIVATKARATHVQLHAGFKTINLDTPLSGDYKGGGVLNKFGDTIGILIPNPNQNESVNSFIPLSDLTGLINNLKVE